VTLRTQEKQDLKDRDERLFAMLAAIPRQEQARGADPVALVLWGLVALTLIGGAILLWMLNQ
jgi:hypothetical protein